MILIHALIGVGVSLVVAWVCALTSAATEDNDPVTGS